MDSHKNSPLLVEIHQRISMHSWNMTQDKNNSNKLPHCFFFFFQISTPLVVPCFFSLPSWSTQDGPDILAIPPDGFLWPQRNLTGCWCVWKPGRLTWNITMEVWKIIFNSKWLISRFHVNLPGCTCNWMILVFFSSWDVSFKTLLGWQRQDSEGFSFGFLKPKEMF